MILRLTQIIFHLKNHGFINKITKEYINKLIDFFAEKYKEIELNKKYYSMCKQYNESIKKFNEYVETFKNCKLNGEPVGYDIDFI